MDKRTPDFGEDLSSLVSDVAIEVGDVLDALRKKKDGARSAAAAVAKPAEPSEPVNRAGPKADPPTEPTEDTLAESATNDPPAVMPRKQRTAPRSRTRASEEEEVVLQNVTTRLRRDTNELLTKAALHQKLKKTGPDSRQDIIEAALQLWFRAEGYAKA